MKQIVKQALATVAVAGVLAVSCTNLDKIEQRVDSLESRVQALENPVRILNENVKSLSALIGAGTIKSVDEKDGIYTLVLSDGQKITLNQGSVGVGNAPVMTVDADGFWMVDYQDGKGPVHILRSGAKVNAKGSDGKTPRFGIDSHGCWTVSYDDGISFKQVLDANGQPVSALPSGEIADPYFKSVEYDAATGIFRLTLKDGTALTLPVVSNFLCAITGAGEVQTFRFGETRTFAVTMEGVASTLVTAPAGWDATLEDKILSVTAPVPTKTVLADNRTDVTVLALSGTGYAALAKIKVEAVNAPAPPTPKAEVKAGGATENSISFHVTLSDATNWKYLVLTSSDPAPAAETIRTSGTEGTGTSATVDNLAPGQEYAVYVLPFAGDMIGSVTKLVTGTTSPAVSNDLYQAYTEGKDIEIAGIRYNKSTDGEGFLVKTDAAETNLRKNIHRKTGIFFLEQTEDHIFVIPSVTEITGNVVLVSRYADKMVTLKPAAFTKIKSGSFVLKNIRLDLTRINGGTNAQYALNNSNATANFEALHFDGCFLEHVSKPVLYASIGTCGIKSLIMKRTTVQVTATGNIQLFNLYKSTVLHEYKTIAFEDNVLFNAACTPIQIVNYDQNQPQSGSSWDLVLTVKNNIFYNMPSKNGHFKFYQAASLTMQGNLFRADPDKAEASYCFILYSPGHPADALHVSDNIAYGLKAPWTIAHSNSTVKPEPNTLGKADEDPFESFDTATGTYRLKTAFTTYGPR